MDVRGNSNVLWSKGNEWGVVDEHGMAVCCARVDGALRTCHDTVRHTIARSAVDAGFRVEVGVYGLSTRALRKADRRRMDAYSVREKQGHEMADRYLIENREVAIGVQMFHMRQRWRAAVWRAQTQVLLVVG
jgi:hypothetical protein